MEVEIKIEAGRTETKVVVVTAAMTDEIHGLVKRITEAPLSVLTGFRDGSATMIEPGRIIRIAAANQKVYAITEDGEYTLRLRLYELEQRLPGADFIRISNSEIINVKKVKHFDLSFAGTICVQFQNGSASYVSRRYVSKIKQALGI